MPSRFGLEIGEAAGEIRLRVSGELDLEVTSSLLDSILSAGAASNNGRVVVDLSQVTFIDSSGLAALVAAHRQLASRSQQLVVADPAPGVSRVFSLAGVDQILAIEQAPTPVD